MRRKKRKRKEEKKRKRRSPPTPTQPQPNPNHNTISILQKGARPCSAHSWRGGWCFLGLLKILFSHSWTRDVGFEGRGGIKIFLQKQPKIPYIGRGCAYIGTEGGLKSIKNTRKTTKKCIYRGRGGVLSAYIGGTWGILGEKHPNPHI